MEYIEFDIKQEIYEALKGKIVPYSVELDCELSSSTHTKLYDSNVYISAEINGKSEVIADFNCLIEEISTDETPLEVKTKGSFLGTYNIELKCFVDYSCTVTLNLHY